MDTNPEARWMTERLDALEPAWSADSSRAHAMLHNRLGSRRLRPWVLATPLVAAACLAVALVIPQTRSFAQEIWARWTVGRLAVVDVGLPAAWHVTLDGVVKQGVDLRDVDAIAGYTADLPAFGAGEQPELSVLPKIQLSQTIDVAAMRAALRRVNALDVQVPDTWDKLVLRADLGPTVVAEYADSAVIAQAQPFLIYVPVGMPLTDIANAIFRSAGMPAAEAKAMALAYAIQPAWFLDIGKDEPVRIEQTTLTNGPAILIEDLGATKAAERFTVLRSTPERLFLIVGPTRERAIALAQGVK